MTQELYGLNDEQWGAITAKSPTICMASAGSGKTRTLVARIRYILDDQGHDPRNILAITFTNKAANEMKERLKSFYPNLAGMQISTIHSMCVKIIKTFIQHTPLKHPFSIYDDSDQMSVIKTVIKARNLTLDPWETLSAISRAKAEEKEKFLDKDTIIAYKAYQEILIKNNALDFDDLLIYANNCLQHDDCRAYYSNLWQHILVDEFQDLSNIQYKIILALYEEKTKTFFAAGDQNQSIYGFRGAQPENMKKFIEQYKPSIINLTFNYRSCSEIITHANNFLQFGKPMVPKTASQGMVSFTQFQSQEDEAEKIALALQKMQDYENTAILFRVNSRTLQFEKVFTQKRIPYKIVGALPFYKRRIAKDLLSYCKVAVNRSDIESLVRIVNVPKRGFGETRQEKLLLEGWPYLIKSADEIPRIGGFINLLDEVRSQSPLDAVNQILHHTEYRSTLKTDNDRIMLDSFLNVISGYDSIDELILASSFIEQDTGRGVKLMSAHASKGLEFDRVFVVGVEDELWPHKLAEDLTEENRLYYVAVTRAKKYINISYSKSRLYRGTKLDVLPSPLFTNSYQAYKNERD